MYHESKALIEVPLLLAPRPTPVLRPRGAAVQKIGSEEGDSYVQRFAFPVFHSESASLLFLIY